MNAMAAAFQKQGVLPCDAHFWTALAMMKNNGRSKAIVLAFVERAYPEDGNEGHAHVARLGQSKIADVSDGRGQLVSAEKAMTDLPRPPYSAEMPIREGRYTDAGKAREALPSRFPPNPPRGLSSIAAVQSTMARSLFDVITLPDGRRLRDIRWNDCPALAQKYRRVAHILTAVHNHAIPPDPYATLDTIVSESDLKEIVATAEEANNA